MIEVTTPTVWLLDEGRLAHAFAGLDPVGRGVTWCGRWAIGEPPERGILPRGHGWCPECNRNLSMSTTVLLVDRRPMHDYPSGREAAAAAFIAAG